MKRILLTSSLLLASVMPSMSQRMLDITNGGVYLSTLSNPTVERSVTTTDSGYRVKYTFDKVLLLPDNLFAGSELWKLDGFISNDTPQEPAYPYASDSFSIPVGCVSQISVVNEDWLTVDGSLSPARQPLLLSDTIGYTVDNVLPIRPYSGWFPTQTVTETTTRHYKGIDIVNIGLSPVQFNLTTGKVRICKTLEYEISFTTDGTNSASETSEATTVFDDPYLSATTLNWDCEHINDQSMIPGIGIPRPYPVPKYLIISPSEYRNAVEDFACWKRTMGFNVTTSYMDSWTNVAIMDTVIEHDGLSYLLLVGNNTQVPGNHETLYGISTLTDKSFVCPDPTELIPEISYGRIPANNAVEAERILNRIINYEQEPVTNQNFYNSNLFISKFLAEYGSSTKAGMRNSQTTYEISKFLEDNGRNVTRLFHANANQTPLLWSDPGFNEEGRLCSECPIPLEMQKPQYAWNASTDDIIDNINSGAFSQVFYFAHGGVNNWSGPFLTSSNASSLTNGAYLPIVFSMACHTGNYSYSGSLAEKFMTASNGGAIAMFGFTNATYVAYTDMIAFAMYCGMWPNNELLPYINSSIDEFTLIPQFSNGKITELGALHRYAITMMNTAFPSTSTSTEVQKYEASMLTLFGDPSMHIPTAAHRTITPSIERNGMNLNVSASDSCIITFYDKELNTVYNFKGAATYRFPSATSSVTMCIHADGIKPVVMTLNASGRLLGPASGENDLVREDRVWKYWSDVNVNMTPSSDILLNQKFSGTTEIDGKTYYNCYVWKDSEEFSTETALLIAYMREENGKVYARYIPEIIQTPAEDLGIDVIPYTTFIPSYDLDKYENMYGKDILLYDSSLTKGDVHYITSKDDDYPVFFTVKEVNEIENSGFTRRYWILSNGIGSYGYLEGIGDLCGLLPLPGPLPPTYGIDPWRLVSVEDASGGILYAADDNPSTTHISELTNQATIVSQKYYTLDGIEVSSPSKGLYIKTVVYDDGNVNTRKVAMK